MISDTTFKYLIKDDNTKKWMYSLIEKITNIDLNRFSLSNNESNTGTLLIKDYRMDIVYENENHIVIIEMQNENSNGSIIKNYQYAFREAGTQYATGQKYTNPKKVTLICFNNYLNPNVSDNYPVHYQLIDSNHKLELDYIESFEIYIPNYHKMNYNDCSEFEKKMWLFGIDDINNIDISLYDKEDHVILKRLRVLNMDRDFIKAYEDELAYKKLINTRYSEGIDKGIEQGIKQGSLNEKEDIAKKLISDNFDSDAIIKYTGLPRDKIELLKKNLNKSKI